MYSGENEGFMRRDYKLLDAIHSRRMRSAKEWFWMEEGRSRRKGKGGMWERVQNVRPILNIREDRREDVEGHRLIV